MTDAAKRVRSDIHARRRLPAGSPSRRLWWVCVAAIAVGAALGACGAPADQPAEESSSAPSVSADGVDVPGQWSGVVDPTAIALGDGKVSQAPAVGMLYSCRTSFGGRGAPHGGPWINESDGTWDSTAKVRVQGSHTWPDAEYHETVDASTRVITSADLPTRQITGTFPIDPTDPAYQYDRNPNAIEPKTVTLRLPANPTVAALPACLPMGPIGILMNGVYLYNALDAAGADAAAHETQDACDGHPDGTEHYHYHNIPSCLLTATDAAGSTLVGYALDGFAIYVERDDSGNLPTNADLDACHGRVSTVLFNGEPTTIYHYSATLEFPYTVGCFRGTPAEQPIRQ